MRTATKISYVKSDQGTRAPQALGHDDSVIMFRRRLLVTESDGSELRTIFDQLAIKHPQVAAKIVRAGTLGEIMYSRAIKALEIYRDTRVAQAPQAM